jgi:hypothetical protein
MTLPNELLFEVASHVEHFRDLNSLLRTSTFFYNLANPILYRRAKDTVHGQILEQVLSQHQIASLELLLDNGLCVHQRSTQHRIKVVTELSKSVKKKHKQKENIPHFKSNVIKRSRPAGGGGDLKAMS